MTTDYQNFLEAKIAHAPTFGHPCTPDEVNPYCLPHARDIVAWAVRRGRAAIFASFGMTKTVIQLETVRLTIEKKYGGKARGLIILPLGVRQEFSRDAKKLGLTIKYIRSEKEAGPTGLYMTNYETVREGLLDPKAFQVVSLDEADILRGFGGSKTFREFMGHYEDTDLDRFVATATPDPNDHIELLAYAAFLGVMDVGQAKTRFFKRDSEQADVLTLHPHKEEEFWLWVASWAIFVSKPSDLGHSDEGFVRPARKIIWHEVPTDHRGAGEDRDGQGRLLKDSALGVVSASREKRDSLPRRMAKLQDLLAAEPKEHWLIWHDLEAERLAIEESVPGVVSVYGKQDLEEREAAIVAFSDGEIKDLAAKPVIAGAGCNFQRHCRRAAFLGIGYKFKDFIQAIHRIDRFGQKFPVDIHIIYTEAERGVRDDLLAKWALYDRQVEKMTAIVRKYGLAKAAMGDTLARSIGIERREEVGEGWTVANNDCVLETKSMASDSVGLVLTSVPFSTQYEYSPSYNDFGHTDDVPHFFRQMDFLTPELYRVLKPGRVLAVHVKDRIQPSGLNGMGFQTVDPFSDHCIAHYRKHGFGLLARKTIETDVVRENAQTYRLGWSEQCKDGSRMGAGLPEYLLIFRKPPTDRSNGYADEPVIKSKEDYSRGRWQFDADGLQKSGGDRLLTAEDLKGVEPNVIFKLYKRFSATHVYDHEYHVKLADALDKAKMLPPSFKLLQLASHNPDIMTDVARMRTLNGVQASKGKEMHLCPLQFDIVDRAVRQYTNPGDEVYDPFGGLMTVPLRAVKLGRRGRAAELSRSYFDDGVWHLRQLEHQAKSPTLFDLEDAGSVAPMKVLSHEEVKKAFGPDLNAEISETTKKLIEQHDRSLRPRGKKIWPS